MQSISTSKLRADIYRILDQILETGIPVEIVRRDRRLRIVASDLQNTSKLERLEAHPNAIVGDVEDLAEFDWSGEWRP